MKSTLRRIAAFTAVAATTAASVIPFSPAVAGQFSQQEVDQSKFVAVASPYRGGSAHQLLILEQVASTRPCWSESGSAPNSLIQINPLLLEFDFTGVCSRSTDSNGYSIRVNGEDLGLRYSLRVVKQNNDMLLVGASSNRADKPILIGRTYGVTNDFAKIALDPGWRFTKRVFGDRTLGHVYLTYEGSAVPVADIGGSSSGSSGGSTGGTIGAGTGSTGTGSGTGSNTGSTGTATRFQDAQSDIYVAEINQAVQTGFISGFEDNTFRPTASLTREQLVSMVLGALDSLPNVNLNVPAQAAGNPYADVEANRWSAAKIQFARDKNIVSGYYEDGTFRPSQLVTRAELMAVLRRAAEYGKTLQGQQPQLQGNRPTASFADTTGHWANSLIGQMSSYCNVASPLNETGASFAPDTAAQRNYAAAATLRTLSCLSPAGAAAQAGPR